MKLQHLAPLLLAAFVAAAQAQTTYDQLETGAIVQGAVGMGVFSKAMPLPGGPWKLVSRKVIETPLINSRDKTPSGSLSSYLLTLRNLEQNSLVPLVALSITEQRSNFDQGASPCVGSNNRNQWFDDFSEKAGNGGVGCATSTGVSNFRKMLADAATSSNAWVKNNLQALADQANSLPDNVVVVEINARRFRGKSLRVAFILRQEANLTDTAYAAHLKPWIHATGLALLAVVENDAASIAMPTPFATPESAKGLAATPINNQVQSSLAEAVALKDIRIPSHFDFVDVTAANFREVLLQCLPQFAANATATQMPPPAAVSAVYAGAQTAPLFVLKKSKGLCVHRSASNFPIFAADEFLETITPAGVADSVIDRWNQRIAELIARKGEARIAYVFGDGHASIATYWVHASQPLELHYAARPKAIGEWEQQDVDARFADPALVAVNLVNADTKGEGKKSLPY